MNLPDKSILIRIALSIVLAAAALGLFLLNQRKASLQPNTEEIQQHQRELSSILGKIDHDVDSILTRFGIEKEWIQKRQLPLEKVQLTRTERRVAIPQQVLPITMNAAFNTLAKRYKGRAVASENLKENTVAIHIEIEGYIIQTIIVKPTSELRRSEKKQRQANA